MIHQALQGAARVAKPLDLGGFLYSGLQSIAPYCVLSGVKGLCSEGETPQKIRERGAHVLRRKENSLELAAAAPQTRLHADLRLLAQALERCVPGLDNFVDEPAPRVERDKRGFYFVDREPPHVVEGVPECFGEPGEFLAHGSAAHEAVVGINGNSEIQTAQHVDGVFRNRGNCSRLDVRCGTHFEWYPLVEYVRRKPAEFDRSVVGRGDVVDYTHPMAEPVGSTPLNRLPD